MQEDGEEENAEEEDEEEENAEDENAEEEIAEEEERRRTLVSPMRWRSLDTAMRPHSYPVRDISVAVI